jgi:tetratricopeptide (TPR) repeat protein
LADSENSPKEPASALLWAYYYLAQHYDFLGNTEKALSYIDAAIDHTPTLIELFVTKGRIYKVRIKLIVIRLHSVILLFKKKIVRRMASSGMLRCVALVRTDVSEELNASLIKVTRISELGTTLAVTSNLCTQCASVGSYS